MVYNTSLLVHKFLHAVPNVLDYLLGLSCVCWHYSSVLANIAKCYKYFNKLCCSNSKL